MKQKAELELIWISFKDVSDKDLPDVKEDAYLIQSHPKIRLRRAAANEKKPPPPKSHVKVPDNEHTTAHDAKVTAALPDAYTQQEHLQRRSIGASKAVLPQWLKWKCWMLPVCKRWPY